MTQGCFMKTISSTNQLMKVGMHTDVDCINLTHVKLINSCLSIQQKLW